MNEQFDSDNPFKDSNFFKVMIDNIKQVTKEKERTHTPQFSLDLKNEKIIKSEILFDSSSTEKSQLEKQRSQFFQNHKKDYLPEKARKIRKVISENLKFQEKYMLNK